MPIGGMKNMPTAAQKAARDKWDRQNMKNVACKVTKEKADRFKLACEKLGTTRNAVLSRAIDETIKQAEDPE